MFGKIVIGVDGCDGGADALVLGRMLASAATELVLVHAYPLERRASRASELDYDHLIREDAENLLAAVAPAERPATLLPVGDLSPARALHEAAEREGADLIVVGSCRRSLIGRVVLGDVSRSVLHGAPCPVAVAPSGYRMGADRFAVIGAGFNGTEESAAALALADHLARGLAVPLRVLTAAPAPAPFVPGYAYSFDLPDDREHRRLAAEQALAAAVARLGAVTETEVVDEAPGPALEQLSERVGLVVVGSRGWGAAHRVVLGSSADHLVHHARCPVVVVPAPGHGASQTDAAHAEAGRA